ncbi:MAG: S1C family serine protease [Halodesulfurarchaeum sp.]
MRVIVPVLVAAVFLGAAVGAAGGVLVFGSDVGPSVDVPLPDAASPGDATSPQAVDYQTLYTETEDSVVKIQVETTDRGSQGSGFLYDDRHVVTNEHVVGNATTVSVQFSGGTWRSGTVVGTDVYTDLAVVQVDSVPQGFEPLALSTSMPGPGEPVAALGSPFGLQGTITHGIVSGVNRSMRVDDRGFAIPDTVQTDAPINPGNSGGPLVSMEGEVVGVNRAKEGDNIGFAISAQLIERIVPSLITDGEVNHAYLGVRSVPVTPAVASEADVDLTAGVAVVETISGGPADGILQTGDWHSGEGVPAEADIIVAIDGQPVRSGEDLSRYLMVHASPGETVPLTVYREGERVTVNVELGERPGR